MKVKKKKKKKNEKCSIYGRTFKEKKPTMH